MAVLSDADRLSLWSELMSELSAGREGIALTKTELKAALDAADGWADSNAASFNSALPAVARTGAKALTARQKAKLLMFIIRRRYEVS